MPLEKLLSKDEVALISMFQSFGNYGYESAYGVVNSEAPYLLVETTDGVYWFTRDERDSELYLELQTKLRIERQQLFEQASF